MLKYFPKRFQAVEYLFLEKKAIEACKPPLLIYFFSPCTLFTTNSLRNCLCQKSHTAKYFLNVVTIKDINKSMISFITHFVNLTDLFVDRQNFDYIYSNTWIFDIFLYMEAPF